MAFTSKKAFIQDQCTFMMSFMALLPSIKVVAMVHDKVALFTRLIVGIVSILIQCDYINDANDKNIPKILPYDFCAL